MRNQYFSFVLWFGSHVESFQRAQWWWVRIEPRSKTTLPKEFMYIPQAFALDALRVFVVQLFSGSRTCEHQRGYAAMPCHNPSPTVPDVCPLVPPSRTLKPSGRDAATPPGSVGVERRDACPPGQECEGWDRGERAARCRTVSWSPKRT